MKKQLFLLSMLFLANAHLSADCNSDCGLNSNCDSGSKRVLTSLIPRSQERNRPQQLVGLCEQTYLLDAGPFYGAAALTGAYSKTFQAKEIAEAFFGPALFCNGDHPYIKIQGNAYLGTDRDPKALFADYFYLPQNYSGQIAFNPQVKNYTADLDLYFGLNNLHDGLYVRAHSPLVYTKWDLGICEKIITPGSVDDTYGYFTPDILPANQLLSKFTDYGCGKAPGNGSITQARNNVIIFDFDYNIPNMTILFDPLYYAKLPQDSKSKTGLGDIRIELGKVFKETEKCNFSANLQLLIPTGTKKKARYLFEPVIGNGHHWEFGGGFQGHYMFYQNTLKDAHASLHGDFNITHLFATQQKRTFDLKCKELSRYMLATRFTYAISPEYDQASEPSAQFANEYAPVANISTLDVNVSVGIQIDASAFIHYRKKKWDFDLGYNLWYRSKERICRQTTTPCCNEPLPVCDPANKDRWALKGDARMYGFEANEGPFVVIPLSATESKSTIYQGTNKTVIDCNKSVIHNANIDNPILIDQNFDYTAACPFTLFPSAYSNINISVDPLFIQCSDLDIQGTHSISNKIFANAAYEGKWRDYKTIFGFGGSAEFGIHDNDNHTNFALSQWAVWIKGALAFD